MSQPSRFFQIGVPQHICCRGNQRQDIFSDEQDRRLYTDLLVRHASEWAIQIVGYCLMSNHVHLILYPTHNDTLSPMMQRLNSRYAQETLLRTQRTGHLWHSHFRASPMDNQHMWTALRYVELNPVRAGLVRHAEDWPWSSATAHMGLTEWPTWLDRSIWAGRSGPTEWADCLREIASAEQDGLVRRAVHEGRPLASEDVVAGWEVAYRCTLRPRTGGRPKKGAATAESTPALYQSATG